MVLVVLGSGLDVVFVVVVVVVVLVVVVVVVRGAKFEKFETLTILYPEPRTLSVP